MGGSIVFHFYMGTEHNVKHGLKHKTPPVYLRTIYDLIARQHRRKVLNQSSLSSAKALHLHPHPHHHTIVASTTSLVS